MNFYIVYSILSNVPQPLFGSFPTCVIPELVSLFYKHCAGHEKERSQDMIPILVLSCTGIPFLASYLPVELLIVGRQGRKKERERERRRKKKRHAGRERGGGAARVQS